MSIQIRSFDDEMPRMRLFSCVCPHCGYERMAVDNGHFIQARFTQSAVRDSAMVRCEECGAFYERRDGMKLLTNFSLEGTVRMAV